MLSPRPAGAHRSSITLLLVLLAALYTVSYLPKPLTIDDAAYYYYARQLARHPADPYGFEIFWYQHPVPANEVLAPPVVPAWWSLAIRLFGDSPLAWRLWMFPFAYLLVRALHRLSRQFARGMEWPVVVGLVFSPVFLPAMNFMLDVPMLALALTAIDLFVSARGLGQALLAGVVAALAMQTKYTAFLAPAAMVGHALLTGQIRQGLVAVCATAVLFGLWELFVSCKYGESHFLYHSHQTTATLSERMQFGFSLRLLLGSAAGFGVLFLFAALGLPGPVLSLLTLIVVLSCFLPAIGGNYGPETLKLHLLGTEVLPGMLLDTILGTLWLLGSAVVACRLLFRPLPGGWFPPQRTRRADWFLAGWLLLELAGFFLLPPFPAVRRLMGPVVVGSLLAARLAARTCASARRRALVWWIMAGNCLIGLLVASVDAVDAYALKNAAERSAAFVRDRDPDARIWCVGHWGFQYYAERAGMMPIVPDETIVEPGDWLVLPDTRLHQQRIAVWKDALTEETRLTIHDRVPLRTIECYYHGATVWEHHSGLRWTISIYRAPTRLLIQNEPADP